MSIYDINYNNQGKALTPPDKRLPKMLAWIYSLMKPLQYLRDSFFGDYIGGAYNYPDFVFLGNYPKYSRVIWVDKAIYEAKTNVIGLVGYEPTGGQYSEVSWMKVQDNFIGARERAKYNSQIILLEYELNKWYRVAQVDPQIYIAQTVNAPIFLMGQTGPYSSPMPGVSNIAWTQTYMCNVPSFTQTDFTIYVPSLLFLTLGPTVQDRENNIRSFVDQYRIAGITYTVTIY